MGMGMGMGTDGGRILCCLTIREEVPLDSDEARR